METQEIKCPDVIIKSPQEAAAQVLSVYSPGLAYSEHPRGKELDEHYKQQRKQVEDLLKKGVDDSVLSIELQKMYQDALDLGIYAPLQSKNSLEFEEAVTQYYKGWGYSDEELQAKVRETLDNRGYLAELRKWRKNYENEINGKFDKFIEQNPMSEEEESKKIAELREKCIFTSNPEQSEALKNDFPGGNFLLHTTNVEQAIQILESGALVNYKTIYDREEAREKTEGEQKKYHKHNSGYEGISWNYNKVEALPGDRYHLTGFLASPQKILTENLQLAIPSRPAPHELILINGDIDDSKYYDFKTQQELCSNFGLGESNSVLSNLIQLSMFRENQRSENKNTFSSESMLNDYLQKPISDQEREIELRGKYSIRENGTIEFARDLLQQTEDDIPVGAVWLQALIDTGRIKNVVGFEECLSVRQIIESIEKNNYKGFFPELNKERHFLEDTVKVEDDKVTSIGVSNEEMYFVTPQRDLDKWLKVFVRCQVQPKGIIVYDSKKVRLENFASIHRGDNKAMTEEIRTLIPVSEGYIDYENQLLGQQITNDVIAGYRRHVLGEQVLVDRKALKKNQNNELIIV